jgi:esterase/lipase superfamily enzyme
MGFRCSPSIHRARTAILLGGVVLAVATAGCKSAPRTGSPNEVNVSPPETAKPAPPAKPAAEPSLPPSLPQSNPAPEEPLQHKTRAAPPPPPPHPPAEGPANPERPSAGDSSGAGSGAGAGSAAGSAAAALALAHQRDSNIVRVYYATDRQEVVDSKPQTFGPNENPANRLNYGIADVSIPPDHRIGKLEEPILDVKVLYNPAKYVTVLSSNETDEGTFFSRLKSQVSSSPQKEALIFIHGFNVAFNSALRRTAQLSYDLQFPGATICYSWPSRGSMFAYTADEDSVQWTAMHLSNFLQAVYEKSGATSIDIIAHSMGNRALLSALQLLGSTAAPQFDEVVLAAPDVASSLFVQLVPTVQKHARRITLYASSKDQALVASARVNHYRRAGDSRGTLTIIPPVETIDASAVDTGFLGHSYFGDNSSVLSDLYYLLKDGFPAAQRSRLESKTIPAGSYWVFRP